MNKGLFLGAVAAIALAASPAFAEQYGGASGSVDSGASASSGDALVIAGSAVVAAGLIGGGVALASDKGHGGSTTTTSTSTSTATSTGN